MTVKELKDIKGSLTYQAPSVLVKSQKETNLEAARLTAVWPDATLEQLQDEKQLQERLPALLAGFRKDVESFGFVF